jgi:hypothetical protein
MLAHDVDQLALDHEADDQLALDQEADDQLALDQEADDQLALDQEADDQLALDQEAWFHAGSVAAVAAHATASNVLDPVRSVFTNAFRPAFGFASPSATIALERFTMPTPSAPAEP